MILGAWVIPLGGLNMLAAAILILFGLPALQGTPQPSGPFLWFGLAYMVGIGLMLGAYSYGPSAKKGGTQRDLANETNRGA